MITDLQKENERLNDEIIKKINILNKNEKSIFKFTKSLLTLKKVLIKNKLTKKEIKIIIKNWIKIFLFKKFILKSNKIETLIETDFVPQEIIMELKSYIKIDKKKVKDKIFRQDNIIPIKNSNLDKWIQNTFLKKIKKYLRGVIGYKVHARFASNYGKLKDSKRFKYSYSNFHWDEALNAMPYVIYLSDVKRGDGEFKILESSVNFNQNLYLSAYDNCISQRNGINNSIMSNRVGSHLNNKYAKEIDKNIRYFEGNPGTAIFFSGRHILHCGGYPDINKTRMSVFLSHKNILFAIINQVLKIIDFI